MPVPQEQQLVGEVLTVLLPAGTYNDLDPDGMADAGTLVLAATTGPVIITGLASNHRVKKIVILTPTPFPVTLKHQDSGSAVENRFTLQDNVDQYLGQLDYFTLFYDAVTQWSMFQRTRTENFRRQASAVSFGSNQNDFAPGGADAWRRTWWVRLDPSSDNLEITGFAAPSSPVQTDFLYQKRLVNVSDKDLFLTHQDVGSSANNRTITNVASAVRGHIPPHGIMDIYYDLEEARWRISGVSINALENIAATTEPGAFVRDSDGKTYAAEMARATVGTALVSLPGAPFAIMKGRHGDALSFVLWGTEQVLPSGASMSWSFGHLSSPKGKLNGLVTLDHVGAAFNWAPGAAGSAGAYGRLSIIQGVGGSKTITTWTTDAGSVFWPGGTPPVLSTVAGKKDIIEWYSPDGVDVYAKVWGIDFS